MDRAFWFAFCRNAKYCLAMAYISAAISVVAGGYMGGVAGEVAAGLGLFAFPLFGIAMSFAHFTESAFAPAPQRQQSQTTP